MFKELERLILVNYQTQKKVILMCLLIILAAPLLGQMSFIVVLAALLFVLEQYFFTETHENARLFKINLMVGPANLYLSDIIWALFPIIGIVIINSIPSTLLPIERGVFSSEQILLLITISLLQMSLFNLFSLKMTLYVSLLTSLLVFMGYFKIVHFAINISPVFLVLVSIIILITTFLLLKNKKIADTSFKFFL